MLDNLNLSFNQLYTTQNIQEYIQMLVQSPGRIIWSIVDIALVLFLIVKMFGLLKDTRVWQLIKGVLILIVCTILSGVLQLTILNTILTSVMLYGGVMMIVIFQPELRRALEQLGTSKLTKFFGIDKDIETKTKENIYKLVLAAYELSKNKTGALIVIERDIKIQDIISTGIPMEAEISPQLLVNIFVPNTPLHDGAVIIRDNKIAAASCMLPLANNNDIARELGTRHRAAIGISKESDAMAIVVSEETGKISIAKDGTLIADVKEEVLKKILIKNLIISNENNSQKNSFKEKMTLLKNKVSEKKNNK